MGRTNTENREKGDERKKKEGNCSCIKKNPPYRYENGERNEREKKKKSEETDIYKENKMKQQRHQK